MIDSMTVWSAEFSCNPCIFLIVLEEDWQFLQGYQVRLYVTREYRLREYRYGTSCHIVLALTTEVLKGFQLLRKAD